MEPTSNMIRSLSRTADRDWSRLFDRGDYLALFFDEKDIPDRVFDVTDSHGVTHSIPNGVVVEAIAQTRGSERRKIEDTLRKIDFRNGDVNHFFEHLAKGLAETYAGVLRFSSTRTALNRYNPNEMIGQAIRLFEDDRFGLGDDGRELADELRQFARKAELLWRQREK